MGGPAFAGNEKMRTGGVVKGGDASGIPGRAGDVSGVGAPKSATTGEAVEAMRGWLLKRNSKVGALGWNRTWDWRYFGIHRTLGLYYSWKKLTEPVIMGMKSIDVRLNWKGEEILDVREREGKNAMHEVTIIFTDKDVMPLRLRCKDRPNLLEWMAALKSFCAAASATRLVAL